MPTADWITITKETLYDAKVAALVDACDSAALALNQPPRAAGIIQGVVDDVRAAVFSNRANRVDADPAKIPKSLKRHAVALIIPALKDAVELELTAFEETAAKVAEQRLLAVAKGAWQIDTPDEPVQPAVETGGGIETIAEGNSGTGREETAGL